MFHGSTLLSPTTQRQNLNINNYSAHDFLSSTFPTALFPYS